VDIIITSIHVENCVLLTHIDLLHELFFCLFPSFFSLAHVRNIAFDHPVNPNYGQSQYLYISWTSLLIYSSALFHSAFFVYSLKVLFLLLSYFQSCSQYPYSLNTKLNTHTLKYIYKKTCNGSLLQETCWR
jgi:hypothetical protein